MQDLKVSLIQTDLVWEDKKANLATFEKQMAQLDRDVDLIVLPEMFATGFVVDPERVSENPDGMIFNWMQQHAAKQKAVLCGSFIAEEDKRYFNRLIWMRPDGSFEQYDKRHLFSMGGEHHKFTAGTEPLLVELKGWKIKPLICYDLRFPVWAKNNLNESVYDYDVLIYIANWPASRRDPWMSLLKARALENQSYVIGVNRIGEDGNGLLHAGDSNVYTAKGQTLIAQEPYSAFTETRILSRTELDEFRAKFNVGLDWDRFSIEK